MNMTSEDIKAWVVDALEELKAVDLSILDVQEHTSVTDYMIIASGTSDRHLKAMANSVDVKLKQQGLKPLGIEGEGSDGWVLVDLGDVIVHIMKPDTRELFDLEKLWTMLPQAREEADGERDD